MPLIVDRPTGLLGRICIDRPGPELGYQQVLAAVGHDRCLGDSEEGNRRRLCTTRIDMQIAGGEPIRC